MEPIFITDLALGDFRECLDLRFGFGFGFGFSAGQALALLSAPACLPLCPRPLNQVISSDMQERVPHCRLLLASLATSGDRLQLQQILRIWQQQLLLLPLEPHALMGRSPPIAALQPLRPAANPQPLL